MECRGGGRPADWPRVDAFFWGKTHKNHGKSVGLMDVLMDCWIDSGKLRCFIDFLIDYEIMIVEE